MAVKRRMGVRAGWGLLMVGLIGLLPSVSSWALTDAELIAIRDGFDGRRDTMLASLVSSYVPPTDPCDLQLYTWGQMKYAIAALYLNVEPNEANAAIVDAMNNAATHPDLVSEFGLHWCGNIMGRTYEYFHANSSYFPGRLTPAAEAAICEVFWAWAQGESEVAEAETAVSRTWFIWASENHDMMHNTTSWSAAQILKDVAPYNSYTYNDGYSAQDHYAAWTEYFKEYLRERAKRGLFREIGSHAYSKYTLQGVYNFFDLAEDALLSYRAGLLLDLWWADWAHDQINAARGGGKARIYQEKALPSYDNARGMAGYYLNIGYDGTHAAVMCMATSRHRLPLVAMDMALDVNGRGVYEFKSRRPALKLLPQPPEVGDRVAMDPNYGGIYRYTYATPYYILGTLMYEKRPYDDWASSQNRWVGLSFATATDDVIYPQCVPSPPGYLNTYNQYWSVQNKGTLIVQRLGSGYSWHTGEMRVYFPPGLTIDEQGGWVLVDNGSAYAAVKPAWGGYSWDDSNWLRLGDSDAPVIIEAAQASDYTDMYVLFETAVLGQTIDVTDDVLTYTGLGSSGTFTFYTASTQAPKVNGMPIDYEPNYTFESPFLNEDWASGVVTISKDGRQKVLDFNTTDVPVLCGEWGYYEGDLNKDCYVNVADVAILLSDWLIDVPEVPPSLPGVDDQFTKGLWHMDSTYEGGSNTYYVPDDDSANPGRDRDMRIVRTDVSLVAGGYDGGGYGLNIPDFGTGTGLYAVLLPSWNIAWDTFTFQGWFAHDPADGYGQIIFIYDRLSLYVDHDGLSVILSVSPDYSTWTTIEAAISNSSDWQYLEAIYDKTDGGIMTLITEAATVTEKKGIGPLPIRADQPQIYLGSIKGKGWTCYNGKFDDIKLSVVGGVGMPCGASGYPAFDLTEDCNVSLDDFTIIVGDWGKCSEPNKAGCTNLLP